MLSKELLVSDILSKEMLVESDKYDTQSVGLLGYLGSNNIQLVSHKRRTSADLHLDFC